MDEINEELGMFVYSPLSRRVAIIQGTAGILSCITATTLFTHLAFVIIKPLVQMRLRGAPSAQDGRGNSYLKSQVSVFLMALFASDVFQSLGGMMQIRWASLGGVQLHSPACTAQGVALLAGDLGVCYFNVVVAVHTFLTIVVRKTMSATVTALVVLGGFIFAALFAVIGPLALETKAKGPFYGIAGTWCFITNEYPGPRVWLHYFEIYVSVFALIFIYVAVFWKLRTRQPTSRGSVSHSQRANSPQDTPSNLHSQFNKVANRLLWYPTAYLCIVLPISIARLCQLAGNQPSQEFMNFSVTILMMSGFVNGIIYPLTRKALSPFPSWGSQRKSVSSSIQRGTQSPTYAIWVTQERQQHTGDGDDKFAVAVELRDGVVEIKHDHDPETASV